MLIKLLVALFIIAVATVPVLGAATWFVDDNAPSDPGPGNPLVSDPAANGSSAHPFDAVQKGVNAAANGDTVIVRDGTYTGSGNRDIDFAGKRIAVRSAAGAQHCVINCGGTPAEPHRAFHFHSGESAGAVVDGFTITGGYASGETPSDWAAASGGAILCSAASPTIVNNVFTACTASYLGGAIACIDSAAPLITDNVVSGQNSAGAGGGICCWSRSAPTIVRNRITDNSAYVVGGGIHVDEKSAPVITNNVVAGNRVTWMNGGGIGCWGRSAATIINNTITDNEAAGLGGGLDVIDSTVTMKNCIVWSNAAQTGANAAIEASVATGTLTVSYSCVGGGREGIAVGSSCVLNWGTGNLNQNPLFADPAGRDYHLKSMTGRFKPE